MNRVIRYVGKPSLANLLTAWTPLKNPLFRAIWIAAVVSNVGSLMQGTGGSWLITSLTHSSILISLMQVASSLPLVLLCLPGGALADIVDKKKLLVIGQVWMFGAAAMLGLLSFYHFINAATLLILTFILGMGSALTFPAWMASLAEIVEKKELAKALTLNSLSYNLSLVIGPVLAAVVLASLGVGSIFFINAASFLGIIAVLVQWKRKQVKSTLPKEGLVVAIKSSFRYTRYSPRLQNLLFRTALVVMFGSVFWALLPSVARFSLHMDAGGFGLLYAFMGIGSVIAAVSLPKLQKNYSIDQRIAGATIAIAFALIILAYPPFILAAYLAMFIIGMSWITLMSAFNVFVQTVVGSWIRARAIGMYMTVFQAAMVIGSLYWGVLANDFGISRALLIAAGGMIVSLIGIKFWSLSTDEEVDVTPYLHWPQPELTSEIHPKHGPVLVSVVYTINPKNEEAFVAAASEFGKIRRRDGAMRWAIYKDTEAENRFVETFVVESWGEHVRQHHRLTMADKELEDKMNSFQIPNVSPQTRHYIAKSLS